MEQEALKEIGREMNRQDNRGTSYPLFIVVREERIYGIESGWRDGVERKNTDGIDLKKEVCERCRKHYDEYNELPPDCEDFDCDDSFVGYRVEKDVPQLRAGFFLTAEACNAHIEANQHHYGRAAHSYAISAYNNHELQKVLRHLSILGSEDGQPTSTYQ